MPPALPFPPHPTIFRGGWEELQDWGGRPDTAHHHGYEGQDEDPWKEQAGDLWGDPEGVRHLQDGARSAHEEHQAERPGRHIQVVGQNHHQRYVQWI